MNMMSAQAPKHLSTGEEDEKKGHVHAGQHCTLKLIAQKLTTATVVSVSSSPFHANAKLAVSLPSLLSSFLAWQASFRREEAMANQQSLLQPCCAECHAVGPVPQ